MVSQLFIIFTGVTLGIIGSSLSFYYPEILSKNITPISNTRNKQICSVVATLGSIVLIYMIDPVGAKEWVQYLFIFLFYVTAWVDGYSKIIPNKLLLILFILASINLLYESEIQRVFAFLTVILASLLIYWIGKQFTSKTYIGLGDIKLVSVLALYSGWLFIPVIYLGIILAGFFTVIAWICTKFHQESKIPLIPFLFTSHLLIPIYQSDIKLILSLLQN